jgi:hypothetical protein
MKVGTVLDAQEARNDKEREEHEHDDPEDLYPARCGAISEGSRCLTSVIAFGRQVRHWRRLIAGIRVGAMMSDTACLCLHALAAARVLPSAAAVRRLVEVTLAELAPP